MKNYQTLLFDVDDTLLDFGAAEDNALRLLFEEQKVSLTVEIENYYKKMNKGMWQEFELGKLDRNELVNTRFSKLFKAFGQEVDGVLLEQKYRGYLEEGHELIDGAQSLIHNLKKEYDLYIVTNGVSKTQYKRLQDSGLHSAFKDVFVSEDTGYQKPMKEYFDYVFARIPNFKRENSLIIGDTLGSDILGGKNVGMDTCWFNPTNKSNTSEIVPTYQIAELEKLYDILN